MATTYNQKLFAGLWIQRRDKSTNSEEVKCLKETDPFEHENVRKPLVGNFWVAI